MKINNSIQGNGLILDLNQVNVMGIVNATPDSFYTHSQYSEIEGQKTQVLKMIEQGVNILDFGAISTRPGAKMIDEVAEWDRLLPILKWTRKEFPQVFMSVDTFRSGIVAKAFDIGVNMVNDISGGKYDPNLWDHVAELKMPYVLMHMQGNPEDMQKQPQYQDVVKDVLNYLRKQMNLLKEKGVNDLIIDPGFGFGKSLEHNYEMMRYLKDFKILEQPLLIGISRKSMIYNLLDISPTESLNGTSILNTYAALNGANILRVHDVKETVELQSILNKLKMVD